jgi:hypothetical protein
MISGDAVTDDTTMSDMPAVSESDTPEVCAAAVFKSGATKKASTTINAVAKRA